MREIIHILGVPFDVVTMEQAIEKVKGFLYEKGQHIVCTPNPEMVMEAQNDDKLMNILKSADLVVPDGIGVVWASKYSEKKLTERYRTYCIFFWRSTRCFIGSGEKNGTKVSSFKNCRRA